MITFFTCFTLTVIIFFAVRKCIALYRRHKILRQQEAWDNFHDRIFRSKVK